MALNARESKELDALREYLNKVDISMEVDKEARKVKFILPKPGDLTLKGNRKLVAGTKAIKILELDLEITRLDNPGN